MDSEHLTQVQNQYNAKIENLVAELEQARNEAIVAKRERETMQKKYEFMDDQLVKMTIRNRQASDLIKNCKKEGGFEAKGTVSSFKFRRIFFLISVPPMNLGYIK